jgi:flagellin-like hook-associated protein FlgL
MAMNDISLTAGMRNNLVSLQNTERLLNRTQDRLSTGKKINSALDDPSAFFAARGHYNRAADLAALKDSMGEAVQTLKSADNGIESITAMIESAKAIANDALSAEANYVTATLSSVAAGNVITIGTTAYTATGATVTAGAAEFNIGSTDAETAQNLANLINSTAEGGLDLSATLNGTQIKLTTVSSSTAITQTTTVSGTSTFGISTSVTSDRSDLAATYNNLMTQIDSLASDSIYKGKNLLKNDDLTVEFEGGTLTVNGFSATASDLTLSVTASGGTGVNTWAIASNITADQTKLNTGLSTLRSEASKLATNLSTISIRQDFTSQLQNVLQEGGDKLTLADMNEEGANMLALQTQQALGSTALSLAAQAAQSVLRLF